MPIPDDASCRPRVVFAGTPAFAAAMLEALVATDRYHPVAVYTQPDRPAGRGKRLLASPVKQAAEQHGIPVLQPQTLRTMEAQAELAALAADIMVVAAYGLILPVAVLATPRLGCINVHASLLPRWRGAAPIERAIEAGDDATGITIMQMDKGLDTGAMLATAHCAIGATTTGDSLRMELAAIAGPLLVQCMDTLFAGPVRAAAQDDSGATYARKLERAEAVLDWSEDASVLARRIRAFNSASPCFSRMDDQVVRFLVACADTASPGGGAPGTVLEASSRGIRVQCGNGVLCVLELQLAGGKTMNAAAMLNGRAALFAAGKVFDTRDAVLAPR